MTINRELWLSNADQTSVQVSLTRDLWNELRADRSWRFADLRVELIDYEAVLSGTVPRLVDKLAAERAAKRVRGIQAVRNEIIVDLPRESLRSDADLLDMAFHALAWNSCVPAGHVRVRVESGWITLSGVVDTEWERTVAEETIERLVGVRGVTSTIRLAPAPAIGRDVRSQIDDALHDDLMLRGAHIKVAAHDHDVLLRGRVHSLAQREEAERVARALSAGAAVIDRLEITP
jgi:osmotically-inducible protein OsmY